MKEQNAVLNKHARCRYLYVRHRFALSEKFLAPSRPSGRPLADWQLLEDELGVPTYGSKHRMDLSLMPDVTTVVQVEE